MGFPNAANHLLLRLWVRWMGPGYGLGCHDGGQGVTVLAHLGVRFGYLENCSSKMSLSELEEIS